MAVSHCSAVGFFLWQFEFKMTTLRSDFLTLNNSHLAGPNSAEKKNVMEAVMNKRMFSQSGEAAVVKPPQVLIHMNPHWIPTITF